MGSVGVSAVPISIDWLPDERLLVIAGSDRRLLRADPDGSLEHVDLANLCDRPWNEIVVDGRGNVYLNGIGFDMMAAEDVAPGFLALVLPDGSGRRVADGVSFPNGMAVTPDNSTLILAES
jgi:sugar lactone lactonase YvrE